MLMERLGGMRQDESAVRYPHVDLVDKSRQNATSGSQLGVSDMILTVRLFLFLTNQ